MFVIPSPPPSQSSTSQYDEQGTQLSKKPDAQNAPFELEIDLPAPSRQKKTSTLKGHRSTEQESLAAIPLELQTNPQKNSQPRFRSTYARNQKSKSSGSRALLLTLGILAALMLAGGAVAGVFVATKSFMASMPRTIAIQKIGTDVLETEATEAASKWIENAYATAYTPLREDPTRDEATLLAIALDKVSLSPELRAGMLDKMKPLVKSICEVEFDADNWNVLQATSDSAQPVVSIRLRNASTGELAYVRVRCRRSQDLVVRVCDIDHLDGQGWASEQLKRHLIVTPAARQAVIDTFSPVDGYAEDSMVEKMATLGALPAASASSRVAAYKGLLTNYALQPAIHRMYVMSCSDPASGENFRAAYSGYKSMHPSDNDACLFAIKHLPSQGIYNSIDSDIESIEQIVGKDPYLDWYRALSAIVNNRYDASIDLLEKVTTQSWSPIAAKVLLAYAKDPTGLSLSISVPLLGDHLASMKNLLVKPKSSDELAIEAMNAYTRMQADESAKEANSARRELVRQQMEMDAYSRTQADNMPRESLPSNADDPNYNPPGEMVPPPAIPGLSDDSAKMLIDGLFDKK